MRINHTVKTLVISDFITNAGMSVFSPVFAIFVTGQISGGDVRVVGFAAAITQIVKAVLQIPIARWLDKNHGEYDDFFAMVTGSAIIASTPFLYIFASQVWHIYVIQAALGLGAALAIPPWYAIFTRHIDKMRENVEWSVESIAIGVGGAAAAAVSGVLVSHFGFKSVFVIGGLVAVTGMLIQTLIYRDLRLYVGRREVEPLPDRLS